MTETHTEPRAGRRGWLLLASGLLLLVFGWLLQSDTEAEAAGAANAAKPQAEVLAVVQGVEITEADVRAEAAEQLDGLETQRLAQEAQYRQQRYQILKTTLDSVVEDRLLAAEAKARSISKDELIAAEITAKIEPVTDADVDTFYEQRSAQQRLPPKENIADQIRAYLSQQKEAEARTAFVATLRAKYDTKVMLDEFRLEVAAAGHPAKGPGDAPVTIVEFSDFQCPFCSRILPVLDQAKTAYGDKIRIVFRQFPLRSIHPLAQKAAEASLCAADQGKFWEYHDNLFANQQKLDIADLKAAAGTLGLDQAKFDGCLDSGAQAAQVAADLREGAAAGVSGTPAMFVNGRFLNGVVPFEQLKALIDEELARAKKG